VGRGAFALLLSQFPKTALTPPRRVHIGFEPPSAGRRLTGGRLREKAERGDQMSAERADRFAEAYSSGTPPWDIGRAQPVIVGLAEAGEIVSPVLDVGCGTGENALELAARGHDVTGVDAIDLALQAARAKATSRGLVVSFEQADALALEGLGRTFATVIDSGFFHTLDDEERQRFAATLAGTLRPGGRYFMLCFSEHQPGDAGPRRVTQREIRALFDQPPFRVLSIEPAEMSTRLPSGAVQCWLARVERS
jgi:SAM-dependent methyltransferase